MGRTRNEEADCPGIDVQRGERFRKIRRDLLLYKCRVREDEHEGLGRTAALLVRVKLGNYRTAKFRSFSLVYL